MAGVALRDPSGSVYQVPRHTQKSTANLQHIFQTYANDDIAPHRPDAFRSHWSTCERRGKDHSLPSHGGHIDSLLAAGVLKEHGDRRHFTHDPTPVHQWRPCRVTLYVACASHTVFL